MMKHQNPSLMFLSSFNKCGELINASNEGVSDMKAVREAIKECRAIAKDEKYSETFVQALASLATSLGILLALVLVVIPKKAKAAGMALCNKVASATSAAVLGTAGSITAAVTFFFSLNGLHYAILGAALCAFVEYRCFGPVESANVKTRKLVTSLLAAILSIPMIAALGNLFVCIYVFLPSLGIPKTSPFSTVTHMFLLANFQLTPATPWRGYTGLAFVCLLGLMIGQHSRGLKKPSVTLLRLGSSTQ